MAAAAAQSVEKRFRMTPPRGQKFCLFPGDYPSAGEDRPDASSQAPPSAAGSETE